MGLNKSKKRAMVLVLILMIITSLSIFIIGALKILTATDTEFSFNRNSTGNPSNKISGKFICYKKYDDTTKTYKLYQQRVEYNIDGSIKSLQSESERTNKICEFEVPNGVKTFEITAIGGGGAGGDSKRTYEYDETDSTDCIKDNIDYILHNLKAQLSCTNRFSYGSCTYSYDYGIEGDLPDFQAASNRGILGMRQVRTSGTCHQVCNRRDSRGRCTGYSTQCSYNYSNKYECGNGGTTQTITNENCKLYYTKGGARRSISLTESIFNLPEIEIKQANFAPLIENSGLVECKQLTPKYTIEVGSPGEVGEVITVNTNNLIYGSEDGSKKINIKAADIGDGGTPTTGAGKTTLKYWYKNSKGYVATSVTANGGMKGTTTTHTINLPDQATNIESKEGILPTSFELPSAFNFGGLYAGYYNSETPKSAKYFGASGASGYIYDISYQLLEDNCKCSEINGTKNSSCRNCSSDERVKDNPKTIEGTNGAPGAIVISW